MEVDLRALTELTDAEEVASQTLLSEKSKKLYLQAYESFATWRSEKQLTSTSEPVLLLYFNELSTKYKPSSLWSHYSKIKSTLKTEENISVEKYPKLSAFLKRKSAGFQPKQAESFSPDNINEFIRNASDYQYLPTKVALIMGVMGACHTNELYLMRFHDVKDFGGAFEVKVENTRTKQLRRFTITDHYYDICKKYIYGGKNEVNDFLFQQYKNGKFIKQRIGINSFIRMGRDIACFLKLPNAEKYSGNSFRKSSANVLLDADGNITALRRDGKWKLNTVPEGCIGASNTNETTTDNDIHDYEMVKIEDDTSCTTPELTEPSSNSVGEPYLDESVTFESDTDNSDLDHNDTHNDPNSNSEEPIPITNNKSTSVDHNVNVGGNKLTPLTFNNCTGVTINIITK